MFEKNAKRRRISSLKQARALCIDDSSFKKGQEYCFLIAVLMRENDYLEKIKITKIKVDGFDSTEKICDLGRAMRADIVFLHGTTFGGLNFADLDKIYENLKIPIVAVLKRKPSLRRVLRAIENKENFEEKKSILEKSLDYKKIGNMYFLLRGIEEKEFEKVLKRFIKRGNNPEGLRIADMIGKCVYEF
ncbi:MAG: DUF99 family protein [archaeon]